MVAGVVCASFALILAVLSFVLWRKYFQAAYYYLDDPTSQTRGSTPQFSETYDESEYSSVPVTLWSKHVQDLHADGDIGFSREYDSIQSCTDIDMSCEHSQMSDNKHKNRYVNIVAYDHSRVMLKHLQGQKKGCHDYINGNYIDVRVLLWICYAWNSRFLILPFSLFFIGLHQAPSLHRHTRAFAFHVRGLLAYDLGAARLHHRDDHQPNRARQSKFTTRVAAELFFKDLGF